MLPSHLQPQTAYTWQAKAMRVEKITKEKNFLYISFLQASPAPPAPPSPPAPLAPPMSIEDAQAYIFIFIPVHYSFRLAEQLLGQKLMVFVCSEFVCALESNKTVFPQQLQMVERVVGY